MGLGTDAIFAHEVGHNYSLLHAPCGATTQLDANYPHSGGVTGAWGYDAKNNRVLNPSTHKGVMGYCSPAWISDYHFKRALSRRVQSSARGFDGGGFAVSTAAGMTTRTTAAGTTTTGTTVTHSAPSPTPPAIPWDWPSWDRPPAATSAPAASTLMLWGGADDDELLLEPALLTDGPSRMPAEDGPYRLEGIGPDGRTVFAFDFRADPVTHEGPRSVPLQGSLRPGRGRPAGPSRTVGRRTPDRDDPRDRKPDGDREGRRYGLIRAILRDWDGSHNLRIAGGASIVVSDGLPEGAR